jgi:cell division protease FtsH
MKKLGTYLKYIIFPILFILVIIGSASFMLNLDEGENPDGKIGGFFKGEETEPTEITYNEFLAKVKSDSIKKVIIDYNSSSFSVTDKEGEEYFTDNPRTENFKEFLLKEDVKVEEKVSSGGGFSFLSTFIIIMLIMFGLSFFMKKNSPQAQLKNPAVQSKATEVSKVPKVTFNDIAGNETVKNDVQFIIDFLKNPAKYKKMGARMPKGTILYGPPGTGKTLLAKAIAGEAGVPFFSVSGSDFVEMFVGVGAKRVRELFAEARKKAPAIIFIDEIDAVGKKRGIDNNSEKDQTINALLTQLDGFSSSEGVIVIGATNRLEMLDPALIRPGRFDKHVAIPLPEFKERKEILTLHMNNKNVKEDVNLDTLSKLTIGFSGAGLETLMNESAIIAVSKGKEVIDNQDIDDAYYKVVMKGNKKSAKEVNQEQLRLVAWHEAGHALVAKLLTKKSVPKVTIVPSTNGAGGVTFIIPEKAGLHTKNDLIHEVQTLYAGRIAEYLLMKDESLITTGASQDIKQATNIILGMIKELGMTEEFGMLYVEALNAVTDEDVLREAKKISKEIYNKTVTLMTENQGLLEEIAIALLNKETIEEDELNRIIFKETK